MTVWVCVIQIFLKMCVLNIVPILPNSSGQMNSMNLFVGLLRVQIHYHQVALRGIYLR